MFKYTINPLVVLVVTSTLSHLPVHADEEQSSNRSKRQIHFGPGPGQNQKRIHFGPGPGKVSINDLPHHVIRSATLSE